VFDLRRFLRLAAVQWAEHGRGYLWFLGIGIAIHLCVWLLITLGGREAQRYALEAQLGIYMVGYLVTGFLFALRYFAPLADRESALTWLTRPASSFEKYLLAVIVVAVLYPLAYTLAFQICNLPGAWIGEMVRDAKLAVAAATPAAAPEDYMRTVEYLKSRDYGPYLPFSVTKNLGDEVVAVVINFTLQALTLAGGLYFRRLAWLKTVITLFMLVVLALPLLAVITNSSPGLLFWDSDTTFQSRSVKIWLVLLWTSVPILFWISTFFFLKERELQ
jgi:hypothetical protein